MRPGGSASTGWVRNEPDGSVAAHVEGEADAVNDMVVWLRQGPPAARVRDVRRDAGDGDRRRLLRDHRLMSAWLRAIHG